MTDAADRDKPPVGHVILPPTPPPHPVKVAETARKRAGVTPTDRIEARADLPIAELKSDKERLTAEIDILRSVEIPHLRNDMRWLEARESSLLNALTALRTSYEWAVSFNWFSFALIAIGGCVVSYAAFLPPPRIPDGIGVQKLVATFALALLIVGVVVQGFISYRGARALIGLAKDVDPHRRPPPNPEQQ